MKIACAKYLMAAATAFVGISMLTPAHADEDKSLVFVTTGGAYEKALRKHFFDPFEEKTGIKVRSVAANGAEQWGKVKAMQDAGKVEWDMGLANDTTRVGNAAMLEELDCSTIPNFTSKAVDGACVEKGIIGTIGAQMAAYNAEFFKNGAPNSWADFWNAEKFPGERSMGNIGAPWIEISMALMADGVAKEDIETKPLDLERAFKKLDELKPNVGVWWKSGDQSQQAMRNKEVVMGDMWAGRALSLRNEGLDILPIWNEGIKDIMYFVTFKGAPHSDNAKAFIEFYMERPEAHVAFVKDLYNATPLKQLSDLAPADLKPLIPTSKENWDSMVNVNSNPWVIENKNMIIEEWNKWVSK